MDTTATLEAPIARAVSDPDALADGSLVMAVPVAPSAQSLAQAAQSSVEQSQNARGRRRSARKDRSDAPAPTKGQGLPVGWVRQKDPSGR